MISVWSLQAAVTTIVVISGLLALAGLAGAIYANLRSSALEASNLRLTKDNEYYLRKVEYLEPRVEVVERENEMLRKMHDPTGEIKQLREQEGTNHLETVQLLQQIHRDLQK